MRRLAANENVLLWGGGMICTRARAVSQLASALAPLGSNLILKDSPAVAFGSAVRGSSVRCGQETHSGDASKRHGARSPGLA